MPLEKKITRKNSMFASKKRKGSLARFADSTMKFAKEMGSMVSLRTMSGSQASLSEAAGKGKEGEKTKKRSLADTAKGLYRHPEPIRSGELKELASAVGYKIFFKRTSGAVQKATLVKLNHNKDTVRVEWEEAGHVKVKDIDIATFNELNADGGEEEVDEDIQQGNDTEDNDLGIVKPRHSMAASADKKVAIPMKRSSLATNDNSMPVVGMHHSKSNNRVPDNIQDSTVSLATRKSRAEMNQLNYQSVDNLNQDYDIDNVEAQEKNTEFEVEKAKFLLWFKSLEEKRKIQVASQFAQNISPNTDITSVYKICKRHKRNFDENLADEGGGRNVNDAYNVVGSRHSKAPKELRRRQSSMRMEHENSDIGESTGKLRHSKSNLNKSVSKLSPIKNKKDKHLDPISKLPPTISGNIFSFLDPQSLCNAARASKMWNHIASSSFVWEALCAKKGWRLTAEELQGVDKSRIDWKAYYQMKDNDDYRVQLNWIDARYGARTLSGHEGTVMSLYYSDNTIVTGSYDNTLRVWNPRTGECLRTLKGHSGGITAICVSGNHLYSGSEDKTIKKWELSSGKIISSCEEMQKKVTCLCLYASKCPILLASSSDGIIRAFDENFGVSYLLKGHTESVTSLALYQNTMVSGGDDTTIRIWDLKGRYCNHVLWSHGQRPITSLYVNKTIIVAGTVDPDIVVFERNTLSPVFKLKGHSYAIRSISATPNGKYLISGSTDRSVRIWKMPEIEFKVGDNVSFVDDRGHKKNAKLLKCISDNWTWCLRTSDQDVGDGK